LSGVKKKSYVAPEGLAVRLISLYRRIFPFVEERGCVGRKNLQIITQRERPMLSALWGEGKYSLVEKKGGGWEGRGVRSGIPTRRHIREGHTSRR